MQVCTLKVSRRRLFSKLLYYACFPPYLPRMLHFQSSRVTSPFTFLFRIFFFHYQAILCILKFYTCARRPRNLPGSWVGAAIGLVNSYQLPSYACTMVASAGLWYETIHQSCFATSSVRASGRLKSLRTGTSINQPREARGRCGETCKKQRGRVLTSAAVRKVRTLPTAGI